MRAIPAIALLLSALVATAAHARILHDADLDEHGPEAFAEELATFENMGDGIILTLAACEEEPHCVTAVSDEELSRLVDQLEARIELLEANGAGGDYTDLVADYRELRNRYVRFVDEYQQVAAMIDRDALEGDWVDLLDFGVAEGPQVPEPNQEMTLDRFVDTNMPMELD